MLNRVILMGRLAKEPELRHTQSDVAVASFTLAVDRGYQKDGAQNVDFINVVAWRGTAEFVSKWFSKGQLVAVSGKLQVRGYEDRDGNKRTATEVVADEVFFAESKKDKADGSINDFESFGTMPAPSSEDFEEICGDDGELPF